MTRTVEEHQQAVLGLLRYSSAFGDGQAEQLPLTAARGRVLAKDLVAPVSLPPFDNSQMDGYAVHRENLVQSGEPLRLTVTQPVPAGAVPAPLQPGQAAPIMTGAMLPEGAAAVVPIERANPPQFPSAEQYRNSSFRVDLPSVEDGLFVRRAGSDLSAGDVALRAGTVLGPAQLGLIAACGLATVAVRPRFQVLLLTTGDEVQDPGTDPEPGKIYDANSTLLQAALEEAGVLVQRHSVFADRPEELRRALQSISRPVNLILSTGGISQGAYEVVRQALTDSSVEFLSVAMQPGGPQAIGTINGIPFLGFPGNPVSALVSFEMFLRPALGTVTGIPGTRISLPARLTEDVQSPESKHQVRRGIYTDRSGQGEGIGDVALLGGPGSHLMHALAGSNALVHFPVGTGALEAGDLVAVWLLGEPRAGVQPFHPSNPNREALT
ncbi:molybdopterin molybdenumtransferase MoeA [Arthrobacter sp. JZ12]|uniref:molybdopterin molybdotransferase MoeA n=1 Tax=Arthrobacter sp. JZ12 TaxID=2654190 RepID=UPI002B47091F|nr:gephyrin-like molybdotransferase Glp [Arthrobacter sp. JZ12]WRH24616.1 molybdopterin molybdenumtransferase MoeA [Arthrobacter sp. JZ12]